MKLKLMHYRGLVGYSPKHNQDKVTCLKRSDEAQNVAVAVCPYPLQRTWERVPIHFEWNVQCDTRVPIYHY